jgi:anti-anti-sigma regulatory factor
MTLPRKIDRPVPNGGFDVRTTRCDAVRATLHLSGDLDEGGAAVLAQVIDGHVRAGRRFLRMGVGGLRSLGDAAVDVIACAHDWLLAAKGTMILTGVGGPIEAALRTAEPGSPLLMVAPTAAEALD